MRGIAHHRIKRALVIAGTSLTLAVSVAPAQASLISPQAAARLRAIAGPSPAAVHAPARPFGLMMGHKVG
jgi:hypothetical protein